MTIQWFPGHMAAARKKAAETMAQTDVVIEVVDARLPAASANPMVAELRAFRQRPCLKILNKADLADPVATRAWLDWFARETDVLAVALSCKRPSDVARVAGLCRKLAPHRNDGTKPLRMMIMGIPNVGKSTLMNALARRRVAAVGDEPAVTKNQQRLDLGPEMSLTDTPGLLWPKIGHDSDGYMLAASHAVGVNAVAEEEVAAFLATTLMARYPGALAARYRIDEGELDGPGVVEAVARQRGCLRRSRYGTHPDLEKAAIILLTDFRGGALGRLSLETPESRAAMLVAEQQDAEAGDSADLA